MDLGDLGLCFKDRSFMNGIAFITKNVFGSYGKGRSTSRIMQCVEIEVQLKGINLNLHVPGIDLLTPGFTQVFAVSLLLCTFYATSARWSGMHIFDSVK